MIKKFICVTILVLVSLKVISQDSFGFEAGTVVSSLNIKSNHENTSTKFNLGIRLGINYLHNFTNSFDLESGIFYCQKGQKKEHGTTGSYNGIEVWVEFLETYKLNYLEIPVSINYNFNNLFISTGLYFSYCLNGFYSKKNSTKNAQTQELIAEYTTKSDLFKEDDDFLTMIINDDKTAERFDYGLYFGIGYRVERFAVKSNFDLGIPFIVENKEPYSRGFPIENYRNRALSLSLIYHIN